MKVAIVGAAASSRSLAPFEDKDWLIWACSPSSRDHVPRLDVWFELHDLADLRSAKWSPWAVPYVEWINTRDCRVVMQATNDLVPKAEAYPKDEILAKYGAKFFTSSIAWMIALAMHEGATEIAIYGVDMAADSEWGFERPGAKFWVERARESGIIVTIPNQSDLDFPAPLYGFDDAKPLARKLKAHSAELQDRINGILAEMAEIDARKSFLIREHAHLSGALEQNNYVRRNFIAFSGPDL